MPRLPVLGAAFLAAFAAAGLAEEEAVPVRSDERSFVVYSQPIRLRYGEVHNKMQDLMQLPEDVVARYASGEKYMAMSGFDVDMVRRGKNAEEDVKVKLSDHYLHHYILYFGSAKSMGKLMDAAREDKMLAHMLTGCHGMKQDALRSFIDKLAQQDPTIARNLAVFGSAAGAEYRDNPQRFEYPFRMVLQRPQVWTPTLHVINTNRRPLENATQPWSPLLECPCTPQRKIDVAAGTIDGKPASPPIGCSPEFAATGNPSCHISTYVGGWRCCENEMFLIDTDKECSDPACSDEPIDEVYMKYTFYYEDATPSTRLIEPSACCDATSVKQGNQNIEYDIPICAPGTRPEDCLHTAETVQPLGYYKEHPVWPMGEHIGADLVDLVFAAPHLHVAGLSLELFDNVTGELLCEVHATPDNTGGITYGHGDTPGDENGYMTGLSTCKWGGKKAPRFRRDHPMRTRAVYNATQYHFGIMSLWLMTVSPVGNPDILI